MGDSGVWIPSSAVDARYHELLLPEKSDAPAGLFPSPDGVVLPKKGPNGDGGKQMGSRDCEKEKRK